MSKRESVNERERERKKERKNICMKCLQKHCTSTHVHLDIVLFFLFFRNWQLKIAVIFLSVLSILSPPIASSLARSLSSISHSSFFLKTKIENYGPINIAAFFNKYTSVLLSVHMNYMFINIPCNFMFRICCTTVYTSKTKENRKIQNLDSV